MFFDGLHEKDIFTENYPFRLELNTFENFVWPLHWHHAVELVYPVENNYLVTVNGQEYTVDEKDILFIASGDIHSLNTVNNKGTRYFIQFDLTTLDVFGKINTVAPFFSFTQLISHRNNGMLHHELEKQIIELINEYETKALAYELSLNARIFDILVFLLRHLLNNAAIDINNNARKKTHSLERLSRVFQYIEEQYQNDISLKDVSLVAGFSEYHFSRVFKEVTGNNFHYYLNERRIKKAEKLLTAHDISIINVAHSAGFNSVATFNRTFKKIKGCTPMEYKRLQYSN